MLSWASPARRLSETEHQLYRAETRVDLGTMLEAHADATEILRCQMILEGAHKNCLYTDSWETLLF